MLAATTQPRALGAACRPRQQLQRCRTVVCAAQHTKQHPRSLDTTTTTHQCASGMLSAALAASLVLAPAGASLAAPKAETESFGAERTQALIEQQGTPAAARPDTMKTNVPFQAPGINAPPRGPKQETGSSVKNVLKDVKKSIKENRADPDSAPFGISKGPLVREAKKMGQPGSVKNWNKDAAFRFRKQSADTSAAKGVEKDSKRGIINGRFTHWFGGPNQ